MPFVEHSTYRPPPLLRNPHAQMVVASVLRAPRGVLYRRERFELPDGDFVMLDWATTPDSNRLAVLLHGLESSSMAPYMRGMVAALNRRHWDCLVINARGCGGGPNRLLRAYHSGETADPHAVIQAVRGRQRYEASALVGFSLGGNVALRYAAEHGRSLQGHVAGVAAVSVPCDLSGCAQKLDRPGNRLYTRRFLRTLLQKVHQKRDRFPDALDYERLLRSQTFAEFDGIYTAPVHGFSSAEDYWTRCSSITAIPEIAIPALLINAADDPFLTPDSHPIDFAKQSRTFTLDLPEHGSHVGFVPRNGMREYWHESRVAAFLERCL